jgi:flagellar basal body-associated protein FliL
MAEPDDNPFEETKPDDEGGGSSGLQLGIRIGLMVAVLAAGSGGGYVLGGLIGGSQASDPNVVPDDAMELIEPEPGPPDIAAEDFQYIKFEPITVNLNEPRLARYIRATVVLAIKAGDGEAADKMITTNRKLELKSWIMHYLADLSLEDVRGQKNLARICREVRENCNRKLWPRSRPLIDHVLFEQFNVQ